jgi:hypothetical protein
MVSSANWSPFGYMKRSAGRPCRAMYRQRRYLRRDGSRVPGLVSYVRRSFQKPCLTLCSEMRLSFDRSNLYKYVLDVDGSARGDFAFTS